MSKKTDNPYAEPQALDADQQLAQANADVDRRGMRSGAFDKSQQNLDQYLKELQVLLDARTLKGGLTTIDVQCDTVDDAPKAGDLSGTTNRTRFRSFVPTGSTPEAGRPTPDRSSSPPKKIGLCGISPNCQRDHRPKTEYPGQPSRE